MLPLINCHFKVHLSFIISSQKYHPLTPFFLTYLVLGLRMSVVSTSLCFFLALWMMANILLENNHSVIWYAFFFLQL